MNDEGPDVIIDERLWPTFIHSAALALGCSPLSGGMPCASVSAPPLHPHLSKDLRAEEDRARRDTCRLKASHLPRGTQVLDLPAWSSLQPIRTYVNLRFC